jgi:2-methylaconitate cis-trans-isomerase PrpF
MAPAFDRIRLISKRLENNLNGLQCVEAIRHYAASHDGQLPENLSDISQMEIPKDVMSGKAFEYRRTSAGAVLKSVMPQGGGPKDMVNYVIVLKK